MPQNTSEKRIIDNITQQLRLLGAPSKYVTEALNPVFVANDDLVDQVDIRSAGRTTTGTTAILTTNTAGTTWLTHIDLDLSVSTAV